MPWKVLKTIFFLLIAIDYCLKNFDVLLLSLLKHYPTESKKIKYTSCFKKKNDFLKIHYQKSFKCIATKSTFLCSSNTSLLGCSRFYCWRKFSLVPNSSFVNFDDSWILVTHTPNFFSEEFLFFFFFSKSFQTNLYCAKFVADSNI